jgi:hypothetical protein
MAKFSKLTAVILLFPLMLTLHCSAAYGAPKANLWPYWQKHDPDSVVIVDHGRWDTILRQYVEANHPSGINRFHYKRVSEEGRQFLKAYLHDMGEVKVSSLNRSEQKAFWINLYNALTVEVILTHHPVRSIREINISPGIFSRGPWDAELITIEGQQLSLNDIEHRILRPIWHDNRVHYAVNCASLGCPNLQPQPFTARNTEMLLEKAAREFINHPRGVTFNNRMQVSSIYFWFREDFGGSENGIIEHLQKYLSPENLAKLETVKKPLSHGYNWDLNE